MKRLLLKADYIEVLRINSTERTGIQGHVVTVQVQGSSHLIFFEGDDHERRAVATFGELSQLADVAGNYLEEVKL